MGKYGQEKLRIWALFAQCEPNLSGFVTALNVRGSQFNPPVVKRIYDPSKS